MRPIVLPFLVLTLLALPLRAAQETPEERASQRQDYPRPDQPLPTGAWSAWMWCGTGHALYFELEVQATADGGYRTFVLNASERIEVPLTQWRLDPQGLPVLRLAFPHYDSVIRARPEGPGALKGAWVKKQGEGKAPRRLAFLARHGETERFPQMVRPGQYRSVTGRWRIRFEDSEDDGVLILRQEDRGSYVEGTVLTTTGDYRFLEGRVDNGAMRLSTFDGAHAFLITSEFDGDELVGSFKSGTWYETKWRAVRDDDAALADPLKETTWLDGATLGDLAFPQLDENVRSLADPEWAARPTILNLFGSWCPNCHDEAQLLEELKQTYGEQGLMVMGLAFELPGPMRRSIDQVARIRLRHELTYPTMIAGHTPKPRSTRALGTIDRLRSYPTSIFFRRDGSVAGVHTGFVGPAAGPEYLAERARFEELVAEILASPEYDAAAAAERFVALGEWRGRDANLTPSGNELRTTGAQDVVESYTINHDGERSARFVPGGLWLGDEFLRVARGVAWNPVDFDRSFLPYAPDQNDLQSLGSEHAGLRRASLFRLAHARRAEGEPLPEAIPLLADDVPFVQATAAWALGFTGTQAAREQLVPLGGDAYAPLAREVERALGRL